MSSLKTLGAGILTLAIFVGVGYFIYVSLGPGWGPVPCANYSVTSSDNDCTATHKK